MLFLKLFFPALRQRPARLVALLLDAGAAEDSRALALDWSDPRWDAIVTELTA